MLKNKIIFIILLSLLPKIAFADVEEINPVTSYGPWIFLVLVYILHRIFNNYVVKPRGDRDAGD